VQTSARECEFEIGRAAEYRFSREGALPQRAQLLGFERPRRPAFDRKRTLLEPAVA